MTTPPKILNIEFNQNGTCFTISTDQGFSIYTTSPLLKKHSRSTNGGIESAVLYNRSNILGLLGGGKTPAYGQTKMVLWDDHQKKALTHFNFLDYITSISISQLHIIICVESKIFLFDFFTHDHIATLNTEHNPKGILAFDASGEHLAYPSVNVGEVAVYNTSTQHSSLIQAHHNDIACLTLSDDGALLATASTKGTLVRIYSVADGKLLKELRRGSGEAVICSLSFDRSNRYIACSSDRYTIHVFVTGQVGKDVEEEKEGDKPRNQYSFFGKFLGKASSYFSSEWSSGQVKIGEANAICKFSNEDDMLYVVSKDGKFYKIEIDHKSGNVKIIDSRNLNENES